MALLVLQNVTKRYPSARRPRVALNDVSLDVASGELVAVWGVRRSGRTTLLRVAAGMDRPDEGVVLFADRDFNKNCDETLGREIGYCNTIFMDSHGGCVLDQVAVGPLATGLPRNRARARAEGALARVGAAALADECPRWLDPADAIRVGIARALVNEPRLLLLDEPTNGVDLLQRDAIMQLIRSIANEGIAVLMTVGEAVVLADRVLSIDQGELRGDATPEPAPVVPLRKPQKERSAS
jgi:ABC-type multidrug transport system ATPase subunit